MGEEVAAENPDRFKLWYSMGRPGDDWKYSSGFINAEMIEKSLFAPSEDNLVSSNHGQNTSIDYHCYKVFGTLFKLFCYCLLSGVDVRSTSYDQLRLHSQPGQAGLQPASEI